jgi:hypothetical protein
VEPASRYRVPGDALRAEGAEFHFEAARIGPQAPIRGAPGSKSLARRARRARSAPKAGIGNDLRGPPPPRPPGRTLGRRAALAPAADSPPALAQPPDFVPKVEKINNLQRLSQSALTLACKWFAVAGPAQRPATAEPG